MADSGANRFRWPRTIFEGMREIFFIKERCLPGCRTCYLACVAEHARHRDDYEAVDPLPMAKKLASTSFPNSLFDPVPHAVRCQHCEEAPCVEACISGSMQQSLENGRVFNDLARCVGCWMCVMVCPFGALIPLFDQSKALKCDSCLAVDDPVCVRACPTQALIFCEPARYQAELRRTARWNEKGNSPKERVFR